MIFRDKITVMKNTEWDGQAKRRLTFTCSVVELSMCMLMCGRLTVTVIVRVVWELEVQSITS